MIALFLRLARGALTMIGERRCTGADSEPAAFTGADSEPAAFTYMADSDPGHRKATWNLYSMMSYMISYMLGSS